MASHVARWGDRLLHACGGLAGVVASAEVQAMKARREGWRMDGKIVPLAPVEDHSIEWCGCDTCVAMIRLLQDVPLEALFDEYE
jgi:hypothetical protein